MIDGIINVYKERGFTSHDVVAKLRGILKQKKIGHTGTLDPDAEGVLPVCLGHGTKVCELLTDWSKEYRATLQLGVTTDTQDMTGAVLQEREVTCTEDEVLEVISSFVGEQEQIPPMYSALKVNGKKLYELARQGQVVERKPRHIVIESIHIAKIDLPYIVMDVRCSKGTYIRTLCNDIGEKLGCGGSMKALLRTRVGCFHIDQAVTLAEIEALRDKEETASIVKRVDSIFEEAPKIKLEGEALRLVRNGNPLSAHMMKAPKEQKLLRLYDEEETFLALYEWNQEKHRFQAKKMFL